MRRNKVLIFTLLFALLSSVFVVNGQATKNNESTNVKITVNEVLLQIQEKFGSPFIDNQSRTMIPLRAVSENLGHKVTWDAETWTATIDEKISITIGENIVRTPEGDVEMDTVAILKDDGRTYVPLRFVVEALGYEVEYDGPKASNDYYHTIDILGGEITNPPTDIGDIDIANPERDFEKEPAIEEYLSQYDEDNYEILTYGLSYSHWGVGSALDAISMTNALRFEGRERYELTIKNYDHEHPEVVENLLKLTFGEEAGEKINDFVNEHQLKGIPESKANTWIKMTDNVEFYFDYENGPAIGSIYYIRPIK